MWVTSGSYGWINMNHITHFTIQRAMEPARRCKHIAKNATWLEPQLLHGNL